MGKWTRRAFITTGVLAGGAVVFGVAIRRGNPVDDVAGYMARDDETMLNVWLKIGADNSTTVVVPHAEMGQGVHTTLPMMLADELDADWANVKVLEAPGTPDYANYALGRGFIMGESAIPDMLVDTVNGLFTMATQSMAIQITGGSTSVQFTGELAMRVAGAAARSVLIEAAAERWDVPASELRAENSYVLHDGGNQKLSYAELAADAASLRQSPVPALKNPEQFTLMGRSLPRLDVPAKVDGTALFGIDAEAPGMKIAAVRAAPVFGAKLSSVNDSKALDMPGVADVVELDNAVAVIADGYWNAYRALDVLDTQWTSTGADAQQQSDLFTHFSELLDQTSEWEDDVVSGDAAAALADAETVVDVEYRVPYLAHATMEPMNCMAQVKDGVCDIWTGSQNPLGVATDVAAALEIDVTAVNVHNLYLGGGFGRRAFTDVQVQAAQIAAQVDYPVKVVWSREEDMRQDLYRQATIARLTAGLDASGSPVVWQNRYVDKHDPPDATHIPYDIANQRIQFASSDTHVPFGYWRSVDHSMHGFFKETFIDEVAAIAGKDPYEYRRELLSNNPRFRKVLDLVAEKAGWGTALPDGVGRGIAITRSFNTIVAQVAEVQVADGGVDVQRVVCVVDAGFTVHPDGMIAQMESGIIYGLTAALYGDISIRNGAVQQSNFHDYQMLRMNEAPLIETHIIDSGERIGGAGEPSTPAIAPALANAIYDASGIRIHELPISNIDLRQRDVESRDVA